MYETSENHGFGGNVWGIVIFFLILFWFNGGALFGRNGDGRYNSTNECSPMHNLDNLADIKCEQGKNFAVLNGELNTGFRTTLNQINVGVASIINAQKDQYIKQLEAKNAEMFVVAQNEQTRSLLDRRLDQIECQMLKRPPVYPSVCVPCSNQAPCGSF